MLNKVLFHNIALNISSLDNLFLLQFLLTIPLKTYCLKKKPYRSVDIFLGIKNARNKCFTLLCEDRFMEYLNEHIGMKSYMYYSFLQNRVFNRSADLFFLRSLVTNSDCQLFLKCHNFLNTISEYMNYKYKCPEKKCDMYVYPFDFHCQHCDAYWTIEFQHNDWTLKEFRNAFIFQLH